MSIPHHWCSVPYALAQCSVAGSCTLESRSGTTTVLSSSGSGRKGEGNRFHLPADENLPLGVWPQQHVGRDKRCPVVWPVAGGPQVWSNGESCSVWCHQLPVLCIAAKSEERRQAALKKCKQYHSDYLPSSRGIGRPPSHLGQEVCLIRPSIMTLPDRLRSVHANVRNKLP